MKLIIGYIGHPKRRDTVICAVLRRPVAPFMSFKCENGVEIHDNLTSYNTWWSRWKLHIGPSFQDTDDLFLIPYSRLDAISRAISIFNTGREDKYIMPEGWTRL